MVKNPPANAGESDLSPGSERSPGERNGNPLQYYCLGKPMDRGAWPAIVHGVSGHDLVTRQQVRISTNNKMYSKFLKLCVFRIILISPLTWHFVPISLKGCETQKVVNTSSFHTTPNTSLGLVQATPSKVQPSPTVHTKEALGT